ncbi:MAG: nitroreductase family protein [Candidatus Aminicenantes bacterium]|nr:nitroreductase family protein [Candidatus Aminicenantes bacterium]
MDVLDAIRARRSVRRYKPTPIPEEALARILDAVRLAPSAKNLQPWRFILVRDPALRARVAVACVNQTFMAEAPVIIAACGLPEQAYGRMGRCMNSWPVDVTIAFEHLVLQAQVEGLGTCWIGAFYEEEVKALLGVPAEARVLALTPLGYPAESPAARPRKPLAEIVSKDRF